MLQVTIELMNVSPMPFTSFYKQLLLGSSSPPCLGVHWQEPCPSVLSPVGDLETPFTQQELHSAVFGMSPNKAPGPEGFSFLLVLARLKAWVHAHSCDFYNGPHNRLCINLANIVLLPWPFLLQVLQAEGIFFAISRVLSMAWGYYIATIWH